MEKFTGKYAPDRLTYQDPWWVIAGTLGGAAIVLILTAAAIG